LVVLVVGAEDVHADVHGEADGPLALDVAPRDDRLLPGARGAAGERPAGMVWGRARAISRRALWAKALCSPRGPGAASSTRSTPPRAKKRRRPVSSALVSGAASVSP